MSRLGTLSTLLDDPEVHELIFGLAHVVTATSSARPGAPRLRAVVLRLAQATEPEQYHSWLSADAPNRTMTVEQVRLAIGDRAIGDLALLMRGSPGAVAWQLAAVLPDLVDAASPSGEVLDAVRLAREIAWQW